MNSLFLRDGLRLGNFKFLTTDDDIFRTYVFSFWALADKYGMISSVIHRLYSGVTLLTE